MTKRHSQRVKPKKKKTKQNDEKYVMVREVIVEVPIQIPGG